MAAARARRPGRPVAGPTDQRESLLDAAKQAFARDGYAGASLRAIARDARVSPALAAYYFGDKAGLLQAVLDLRVAPLAQSLQGVILSGGATALARLEAFVNAYTVTAARNRWLPQLIVREVLNEQGVLRDTFARRFAGGLTAQLRALVERGQADGSLRRDLAPQAVVMSLMSLCVFPFIATPMVSGALGIEVSESSAAALAAHHWALFLRGAGEAA